MAELAKMQNDPNFVIEFALGPPASTLVDQTGAPPELNLNFQNMVSSEVTRYVLKSAHLSLDDLRMFDVKTGKLAFVSHHPGKNPVRWLSLAFLCLQLIVVCLGGVGGGAGSSCVELFTGVSWSFSLRGTRS